VIAGLLAMFVMVLGYGILTDLNVDCGCFDAEELDKRAGLRMAFYRDLVLIGVVVPYLYAYNRIRNKTVATEKEIRGQALIQRVFLISRGNLIFKNKRKRR